MNPLLLNLARRARDAKRRLRRHRALRSPVPSMAWWGNLKHLEGAENEAWNSFQATKAIWVEVL